MQAAAAFGLACNVLDFVDTIDGLQTLIKQYPSTTEAPDAVVGISKRIELALLMIHKLNEAEIVKLDHEKLVLRTCCDDAERLGLFLESLKSQPGPKSTWLGTMVCSLTVLKPVKKGWKAFEVLGGVQSLEKFQISLNRILDIVLLQQESTIEVATSRTEIMKILDLRLGCWRLPGQRQVQRAALWGSEGIGKSQIALDYSSRQKQKAPEFSVFWVHAGTVAKFEESYRRIAAKFELPGRDDPLIDVLQLVRNFFESKCNIPWLMIIDNIDDFQTSCKMRTGKSHLEYIPQLGNGSVLCTSINRDVVVDLVGDAICVPPMNMEEARTLLGERLRGASTASEQNLLLALLDNLPLAISQAVSYMNKRHKTIPQYLKLLHDNMASQLKLLSHDFFDVKREDKSFNSVTMTWTLSFQHIKSEHPRAANLLLLMSLLDRQSMPTSLLIQDNENPVDFNEAIGVLQDFSFVSADEISTSYSMHCLVQVATRAWLWDQEDCISKNLNSQAVQILSSRFPDGEFENWQICAQYLPHAESVLSGFEDQCEADNLARAKLLHKIAKYLRKQGKYHRAEGKVRESLEIYCSIGKLECSDALQVKTESATLMKDLGDPEGAVKLYREVLKLQENLLGEDHEDTLETLDKLALALVDWEPHFDFKEAELLARKSLVGREKVLPTNHPQTLTSIYTLAWCLYRQEKNSEAEALFRKCKSQREIVLGEIHPDTSLATNGLGVALNRLCKFEEAEMFLRHSAKVSSILCGDEHHEAIANTGNLAMILTKLGKHDEAEIIHRDQLELCERCLGKNHRATIWYVRNMSDDLCKQKKFEEAESLLREQLLLRQPSGDGSQNDVPDFGIMILTFELADVLIDREKNEESAVLFNTVLAGLRQVVGENHPRFIRTLARLGSVYERLKDFKESEKHLRKEMTLRQSIDGDDDIYTLQTAHHLSRVLRVQHTEDKYKEAEEIIRRVVAKREILLGKVHNDTLSSIYALGDALFIQKKFEEAEIWFRLALAGREETLGESHKTTLFVRDSIEDVLISQKKWEEVAESSGRSLALRRKVGPECYDTLRIACNYAVALEYSGKKEAAQLWLEIIQKAQACYSAYMEQGNHQEAILAKNQEMFIKTHIYGWHDPETTKVRRELALVKEEMEKPSNVEKTFEALLTTIETNGGLDDQKELALTDKEIEKHGESEETFEELLTNMEANWGLVDRETLDVKDEIDQVLD